MIESIMAHTIAALFKDSKIAGNAVAELKEKGYTDNVSVVARDKDSNEANTHQVKEDVKEGGITGAVTGGVLGALFGLLAGTTTLILPGIGPLLAVGPIATSLSALGAATGAVLGGLAGALIDAGISKDQAQKFEEAVKRGEILVLVNVDHENEQKVLDIFNKHRAGELYASHQAVV